ncbi:MAG: caspase family protein, partial [Rhodomicrobium sp.]
MVRMLTAILFSAWLFASPALAEKRVALVIGNSDYASPLSNPSNDADDIAAALRRLQFEVTERRDLTVRAFDRTLDDFIPQAKDADVALFFFSGHGVQIDKRGYLAPIDVKAESESSALRELVAIQEVVSRIEGAAKVGVIVLDACRDNPLQERLRRIAVEKNRGLAPALGLPEIPKSVIGSNTLIVYATAPGETAADGAGRNSPFTASLLKNVETPGLEIELMFKRVTAEVLSATGGRQQPERLSRLQNELVLLPASASARPQAATSPDAQQWIAVQNTTSEAVLEEFIRRFPDSVYAGFAKTRLEELRRKSIAANTKPSDEPSGAKPLEPKRPKEPQIASAVPPKAESASYGGVWVQLGDRKVGFVNDHDTIHVGRSEGKFVRLKLIIRRNEIKLNSVKVFFDNGEVEEVVFNQHSPDGGEAVIGLPHLAHEGRSISDVELHWHSPPD